MNGGGSVTKEDGGCLIHLEKWKVERCYLSLLLLNLVHCFRNCMNWKSD